MTTEDRNLAANILSRRRFLQLSAAAGAATAMAGAFGSSASATSRRGAVSGSTLTVYNWGNPAEGKLYDQLLASYAKAHGNVAVQDSVVPVTLWGTYGDKLAIEVASPPT
jgi:ABC-type glycerol-3-phosphate transport system substrate-binding protein